MALGVLVEVDLDGSALDLGWVNAARWAPYLLVGLFAGVLADRARRRPLLAAADLARAVVLAAVPLLAALDVLTLGTLTALVAAFGLAAVVGDAAQQSFLPRLVGPVGLARANTRLQQGDAAAQGVGPLLGGALAAAGRRWRCSSARPATWSPRSSCSRHRCTTPARRGRRRGLC